VDDRLVTMQVHVHTHTHSLSLFTLSCVYCHCLRYLRWYQMIICV
jgi:hypothetical protein